MKALRLIAVIFISLCLLYPVFSQNDSSPVEDKISKEVTEKSIPEKVKEKAPQKEQSSENEKKDDKKSDEEEIPIEYAYFDITLF